MPIPSEISGQPRGRTVAKLPITALDFQKPIDNGTPTCVARLQRLGGSEPYGRRDTSAPGGARSLDGRRSSTLDRQAGGLEAKQARASTG